MVHERFLNEYMHDQLRLRICKQINSYPNCIKNKYATSRGHVDQGTMNDKKIAYVYVTTRC